MVLWKNGRCFIGSEQVILSDVENMANPDSSSLSDIKDMTVLDGTCQSKVFCCNEGPDLSSDLNPLTRCFYQTGKVSGVEKGPVSSSLSDFKDMTALDQTCHSNIF